MSSSVSGMHGNFSDDESSWEHVGAPKGAHLPVTVALFNNGGESVNHTQARVAWTCVGRDIRLAPFKPEVLGNLYVSGMKSIVLVSRDIQPVWTLDRCCASLEEWSRCHSSGMTPGSILHVQTLDHVVSFGKWFVLGSTWHADRLDHLARD